ncbi:MAG: capsule assembly Wzi family protein, partial [Bacteroidota bacterium]
LGVPDAQNFDFAQSYLRFDANVVSAQIGREKILWGYGAYEKMTMQDTVRTYDFLRLEASYKKYVRYTFMHAWLLGRADTLAFEIPFDTTHQYIEQLNADKYFAAHRLELSWPSVLDFGAQEMVIYSNRSPDLAYLNPLAFIESVQRSRGERDNVFWAFDLQFHMIPNVQLHGSIVYDDIHLSNLFSTKWQDRYAWQAGIVYADPFTIPNVDLMLEYTRVEPYVYSHARSREGSYTSLDRLLGPQIGPNADSWFLRADWVPARNLWLSASVTFERKGLNGLNSDGYLVRNVGGSEWMPHRDTDSPTKEFLDGIRVDTRRIWVTASWEILNQIWLDFRYQYDQRENLTLGGSSKNQTYIGRLRTTF